MIGVTAFGLVFTPIFYVVCRALGDRLSAAAASGRRGEQPAAAAGGMRNHRHAIEAIRHPGLGAGAGRLRGRAGLCAAGDGIGRGGPVRRRQAPAVQPLAPVQGDWWRLYDDPVLDGLIADALAANTDVRVAVARLARARAALSEVKVDRLPQGGVSAGVTRGREPGASATHRPASMPACRRRL